jgi:hypothetical protein
VSKTIPIRRPKIYIAGPMTTLAPGNPGPYLCVPQACILAAQLWEQGWHPEIPHLNVLWEMTGKAPFRGGEWLEYDFQKILDCQAVIRIPGDSHGGQREEELAENMGIPVYRLTDADIDIVEMDNTIQQTSPWLPSPEIETPEEWEARKEDR